MILSCQLLSIVNSPGRSDFEALLYHSEWSVRFQSLAVVASHTRRAVSLELFFASLALVPRLGTMSQLEDKYRQADKLDRSCSLCELLVLGLSCSSSC